MCRIFFSLNNHNTTQIMHHFLNQSIHEKKNTPFTNNFRDVHQNKDGYGLCWFIQASHQTPPHWVCHKKEMCFLQDDTFEKKVKTISKKIVMGHIRYLGEFEEKGNGGDEIQHHHPNPNVLHNSHITSKHFHNTHPFFHDTYFFMQNGQINNYITNKIISTTLLKHVHHSFLSEIKGNTDSEILFYMILTKLMQFEKKTPFEKKGVLMKKSVLCIFKLLHSLKFEVTANIIFVNNECAIITKYIDYDPQDYNHIHQSSPSLYLNYSKKENVKNNKTKLLISSEPLLPFFELIQDGTMFVVDLKKETFVKEKIHTSFL